MKLPARNIASFFLLYISTLEAITTDQSSIKHILNNHASWKGLPNDILSVIAGYHVIYSWPGATLPQELYDLAQDGKVGGVILFGENVSHDLPDEIAELQDVYTKSPLYMGKPLLIVTDQEGGEIVRLPGGPQKSAKDVGSSPSPVKAAAQAGEVAARACKAYKVNGNLAPVLDVYRKKGNFDDQYERSFSKNPQITNQCGSTFIHCQQAYGVVAAAKHFPGLGAAKTNQNTDLGPVTLNLPLHKLRTIDELPFKGAIAAGVSMIMPSWAIYPALDPDRSSGLSKRWIHSELRGRLGFEGVTISDALEAGALDAYGSNATRGALAIEAGIDIALASGRDVSQGSSVVEALVSALKGGKLSRLDFALSTKRILELRGSL